MSKYGIDTIFEYFEEFEARLERLPSTLAPIWSKAVQLGWYPTSCMPANLPCSDLLSAPAIDSCMLNVFEENYSETKGYVFNVDDDRLNIIKVALQLHEQGNYIASIPLLLAQADGLFEEYLGHSVFTRGCDKLDKVDFKINRVFGTDTIAKAYFGQFANAHLANELLQDSNSEDACKAPNRNAILHGDATALDYGSYSNSCKAINFLSSVLWLSEQHQVQQPLISGGN